MPKVLPDYSKTQIYKLKNKNDFNDENIYTGHTTNWIQRKKFHKFYCKNEKYIEYNEKKYKYIRENGGWEEWEMIWIEDYPCSNKREAEAREQYHMDLNNSRLNDMKSFTTEEEKKIKIKEYRENNKDKIALDRKEYREKNKDRCKEWDKINGKKKLVKITCDCGAVMCKGSLSRHKKRKEHIDFLASLTNN